MKKGVLILLFLSLFSSADTLHITFGIQPDTFTFRICKRYIDSLNSRLTSTTLQLIHQPFERSIVSLTSGKTDGDLLRSSYVYSESDPVIKIEGTITPEPTKYYLFALQSYFDTISTIPSPKSRYSTVLHNKTTKAWLEKNNLPYTMVRDYRQIVDMLLMKRIDCLVGAAGYSYEPSFQKAGIVRSNELLFQDTLHLFLHEKHIKAVREIEQGIQSLEKDSIYLDLSPFDTTSTE